MITKNVTNSQGYEEEKKTEGQYFAVPGDSVFSFGSNKGEYLDDGFETPGYNSKDSGNRFVYSEDVKNLGKLYIEDNISFWGRLKVSIGL